MCCCRLQSCCCYPLREGSIAIGIIDVILSALALGLNVWPIVASGGVARPLYTFIAVYAISIGFSILLIRGAVQNKAGPCLAWIIWSSICLVLNIGLLGLLCSVAYSASLFSGTASQSTFLGGFLTDAIAIGIYVVIAIVAVFIFILIYGIMVVNSFRQEVNESGGNPGSYPMQSV
ncbi:PREDICTED: uncharacterized protein LOC109471545 [Branchiostoma belcheri]|uniref:Uncharacterized protein LOC109471545 n=1 Tax=Branchiostoma belcheri TaxID=7741 RepID=A0A6P4Z5U5_BRABE|nr:PREDICTED: uncharacterized protein LOC109471545 [Branchiostoma belcheri]